MTLSATTLWLILAALLGIIELIATTFYLLVLAAAALVAAGAAWFGMELEWQISLFAVIAIVGSVWVRRIRSIPTKSDAQAEALQNLDQGQIVYVNAWDEAGCTTVQYRGADVLLWDGHQNLRRQQPVYHPVRPDHHPGNHPDYPFRPLV